MARSLIGTLLLALLAVLFMLRRKEQEKKAAERQARIDSQGYAPISMDDAEPDAVTTLASTVIRVSRGVSIAMLLFVIAVVAFLAVTELLVKWILTGTLVLMGLIVMIWMLRQRSAKHGDVQSN